MTKIEVAKAAWRRWGDCALDNWQVGDGDVMALGTPRRAKQEYLHVFVFTPGPRAGQRKLATILRAPWDRRIRYNRRDGKPRNLRHLYKEVPWTYEVWGKNYVTEGGVHV